MLASSLLLLSSSSSQFLNFYLLPCIFHTFYNTFTLFLYLSLCHLHYWVPWCASVHFQVFSFELINYCTESGVSAFVHTSLIRSASAGEWHQAQARPWRAIAQLNYLPTVSLAWFTCAQKWTARSVHAGVAMHIRIHTNTGTLIYFTNKSVDVGCSSSESVININPNFLGININLFVTSFVLYFISLYLYLHLFTPGMEKKQRHKSGFKKQAPRPQAQQKQKTKQAEKITTQDDESGSNFQQPED